MSRRMKLLFASAASILSLIVSSCGFSNQVAPVSIIDNCSLDGIAGATQDPAGNFSITTKMPDILLRGWIANSLNGKAPEIATVVITDILRQVYSFKSNSLSERSDVSDYFKKEGMKNSGFEILMVNVKEPGTYTIIMQGKFADSVAVCSRTYLLTVTS